MMDFYNMLLQAWPKVCQNQGSPGIDGISVVEFGESLEYHISVLAGEIEDGSYRTGPLKRVNIRQRDKEREIVILNVRDRVVHQMVAQYLTPRVEPYLPDCCFAYRANRSALMAAERVRKYIQDSAKWLAESDIEHFFDNIEHRALADMADPFIHDNEMRRLLRDLLKQVKLEGMGFLQADKGALQGSPLSPVLSNIYLLPVDSFMMKQGFRFIRYCDDFVVLTDTREQAIQALEELSGLLGSLGLRLKAKKTFVKQVDEGFVFLGYHFGPDGVIPGPGAVRALFDRLEEVMGPDSETDLLGNPQVKEKVFQILRGWSNYYSLEYAVEIAQDEYHIGVLRQYAQETGNTALMEALAMKKSAETFPHSPLGEVGERLLARVRAGDKEAFEVAADICEKYLEKGDFRLAQIFGDAIYKAVPGKDDGQEEVEDGEEKPQTPLRDDFYRDFMNLFAGRENMYALETVDENGQRNVSAVEGFIGREDLEAHLKGDKILGLYLHRVNNTVRCLVIDLDVSKKLILENDGVVPADKLEDAHKYAVKIRRTAGKAGINCYIEDSGWRGRHVWFFFSEAVPAGTAIELAKKLIHSCSPLPEGITCEIFPSRDKLKPNQTGNRIKLPFGVNLRSGRKCYFVDESGRAEENPAVSVKQMLYADIGRVREYLTGVSGEAVLTQETVAEPEKIFEMKVKKFPEAGKIFSKCNLIRYLVKKAIATNYLTHFERQTILQSVGHCGEEGKMAVHDIIRHCLNYKYEITEKFIAKMLPKPVSCPRLREEYSSLTAQLGCDCRLHVPPRGYPSPVLHANKTGTAGQAIKSKGEPAETAGGEEAAIARLTERLINIRKQQKQLDKALARVFESFGCLMDKANSDRLELEIGTLMRKRDNGRVEWVIQL